MQVCGVFLDLKGLKSPIAVFRSAVIYKPFISPLGWSESSGERHLGGGE